MKKTISFLIMFAICVSSFGFNPNINEDITMEMHVVKYEYKYSPPNKDMRVIGGESEGTGYFLAPPTYVGKIKINNDMQLQCEACDKDVIEVLNDIIKTLLENGFENRLNVIKTNGVYSYEIIDKHNPKFLDALKNLFLTTPIKSTNPYEKGKIFFLREIDSEVGSQYLKDEFKKDKQKELLNATKLLGGDTIVEKSWKTLWRPKTIKTKPLTAEQEEWIKTYVIL